MRTIELKNQVFVDVPMRNMTVSIKQEDEGIVIDVYSLSGDDELIATLPVWFEEESDDDEV